MPHPEVWQQRWQSTLAQQQAQGLRRQRVCCQPLSPRTVRMDGRDYLQFASNDYLGLAFEPGNPSFSGASRGAGASPLVSGYQPAHRALEQALCEATGYPAAMLFSSGFAANSAPLSLLQAGDRVLADKLAHASIVDAALASPATMRRFPHNDMATLASWLAKGEADTLVATESVFSMDGDQAPLTELVALCRKHGALSWVDDAHGFGILGEHGLGAAELARPDLLTITFGKAMGAGGAALLGSELMIDALQQSARHYIYSTAMPTDQAELVRQQLGKLTQPERRAHMAQLIQRFRQGAEQLGWQLGSSQTPIQPILVGASEAALALSERLKQAGIWCPAIRPPTVPRGQARLRVVLNAGHRPEDIDRLLDQLGVAL
ncbi:aminotransferase class I/II-fold pyridoxal phosphate-dependent enzyme [Ferrimonas marina]|uniref:8-amino-7-oxononanoate synthase n=1 Tax=Ferrimonas marina TaxID=299255 RepID=A0A1M5YU70_9GAMM|nr:8-amino-7-oxononanoate synthase [Ferrimonas marina]SHI15652.1 8-amino-7-oxononanoate synthase [Ferrimonas marina]